MSPAADGGLAAACAEARARRAEALARRTAALTRAGSTLDAQSDAYWDRREQFLGRAGRGKKLAALLAHDLKNHLAVVKTNVEFAVYELPEGTAGRAPVDEAAVLIEEGFRLTADLVAVEEVAALTPAPATVKVAALFAPVVAELGPLARGLGVTLVIDDPGEAEVRTDPRLSLRVLHNLTHNALCHARATTVRLAFTPAGTEAAVLSVEDDGDGMPAPEAAALSGEVPGPSSGGLAFCRGVVDAQGGALWLDEGRARGTAVRVRLERQAASSSAARAA